MKSLTAQPLTVNISLTARSAEKKFVNGFDIVNGAAVNGKYSVNDSNR